jgi:DNA modification methylase
MADPAPLFRIDTGDAVDVLARMEAGSVHAIVTDPPYGLSREPDTAEVLKHWLAGDDYQHRGSGFMGQSWDSFVPGPAVWSEAFRVLRPGGHLLAFGGTRTFDLLTMAIRLAGFEIRDRILTMGGAPTGGGPVEVGPELAWLYASGWPKGLNVSRAIDRERGLEGEVVGHGEAWGRTTAETGKAAFGDTAQDWAVRAPASPEAAEWEGWSTALKPAYEPIIVARRPLDRGKTIAQQVTSTGTGAININACRVESDGSHMVRETITRPGKVAGDDREGASDGMYGAGSSFTPTNHPGGRWPPNLLLIHHPGCERVGDRKVPVGVTVRENATGELRDRDVFSKRMQAGPNFGYGDDGGGVETVERWECVEGCPVGALDAQSGVTGASSPASGPSLRGTNESYSRGTFRGLADGDEPAFHGDSGAASRFFPAFQYTPKPSSGERAAGLLERGEDRPNTHPTVKPVAMMQWLVRLVTPPGGIVLDPFAGSGTTGCAAVREGMSFVGVELSESFASIARDRIRWWAEVPAGVDPEEHLRRSARAHKARAERAEAGQLDLLGLAADDAAAS